MPAIEAPLSDSSSLDKLCICLIAKDENLQQGTAQLCLAKRVELKTYSSTQAALENLRSLPPVHALLLEQIPTEKAPLDLLYFLESKTPDLPLIAFGPQTLAAFNQKNAPYFAQALLPFPYEKTALNRILDALLMQLCPEPTQVEPNAQDLTDKNDLATQNSLDDFSDDLNDENTSNVDFSLERAFDISFAGESTSSGLLPSPTATAVIRTSAPDSAHSPLHDDNSSSARTKVQAEEDEEDSAFAPIGSNAPLPPLSATNMNVPSLSLEDNTAKVAKGTTTKQIPTVMSEMRSLEAEENPRPQQSTFIVDFHALKEAEEKAIQQAEREDSGQWNVETRAQSVALPKNRFASLESSSISSHDQPSTTLAQTSTQSLLTRNIPHLKSIGSIPEAQSFTVARQKKDPSSASISFQDKTVEIPSSRVNLEQSLEQDIPINSKENALEFTEKSNQGSQQKPSLSPQQLTEFVWGERPKDSPHRRHTLEDEHHYLLQEKIGTGKAGSVYRGRWPGESKDEAIKVLAIELADDPTFRQQFRREIRSQAALNHPNIVSVTRYGRKHDLFYLGMEWMPYDLKSILQKTPILPTAIAAFYLEDLLHGIHFAHSRQVIHRDLKPSNLMLSDEGILKIADFGLAKSALDPNLSSPGSKIGTAAYLSPEQAAGGTAGPRSDLFAIATLAQEMLLGKNPYDAPSLIDTMLNVGRAQAPHLAEARFEVHSTLVKVVQQLGQKEPAKRFTSGLEALTELQPLLSALTERYPNLRQEYLNSPEKTFKTLLQEEAQLETDLAMQLKSADERSHCREISVRLLRANALHPALAVQNQEALQELGSRYDLHALDAPSQKLRKIEQELLYAPRSVDLRQKAIACARSTGCVRSWTTHLWALLDVTPDDKAAKMHLERLIGVNPAAPFADAKFEQKAVSLTKTPEERTQHAGSALRISTLATVSSEQKRMQ